MTSKAAPKQYVNNKALLKEVKLSRAQGEMTKELATMLMLLCERYARKGRYVRYTYNEDMQAFALLNLVKSWKSFNPDKSDNPFAYYTSCVTNSFLQYLNHERKQRDIRDALLIENGLDPSYTYTDAYNADVGGELPADSDPEFTPVSSDTDDVAEQTTDEISK